MAGRRGICPKCDTRLIVPPNDQLKPVDQTVCLDVQVGAPVAGAQVTGTAIAGKKLSSGALPDPDQLFDSAVIEMSQRSGPVDSATQGQPVPAPLVPDWSAVENAGQVSMSATGNASAAKFEDLDLDLDLDLDMDLDMDMEAGSFVLDRPTELADDQPNKHFDWIADSPQSVWYVRHKTGAQYGPANGQQMRAWVSQGRVSNTCHVWREGWANWRQAVDVFPQLASKIRSPMEHPIQWSPTAEISKAGFATESASVAQRGANSWLFVSILLFLAVVAVIVGLVLYQLVQTKAPEDSQAPERSPTEVLDPFA